MSNVKVNYRVHMRQLQGRLRLLFNFKPNTRKTNLRETQGLLLLHSIAEDAGYYEKK